RDQCHRLSAPPSARGNRRRTGDPGIISTPLRASSEFNRLDSHPGPPGGWSSILRPHWLRDGGLQLIHSLLYVTLIILYCFFNIFDFSCKYLCWVYTLC